VLARADVLPVYSISKGEKVLATVFLPQRVHHLGETLSAVFDFSVRQIPCYRLSARLEVQEVVLPKHALSSREGGAAATSTGTSSAGNSIVLRTVYGEHAEFVAHNRNAHLTFLIPHDAPVSFSTEVVGVRWNLNFVFLTPAGRHDDAPEGESNGAEQWTDVLQWSLPIVVTGRPSSQWGAKPSQTLKLQ